MLDSLLSIFKKEKSGKVAKKRLQMVLIQDRASVSPEVMKSCGMISFRLFLNTWLSIKAIWKFLWKM